MEYFFEAGGLPTILRELGEAYSLHPNTLNCEGTSRSGKMSPMHRAGTAM